MSVTNSERLVTKQDLKDFYDGILPYIGGVGEIDDIGDVDISNPSSGEVLKYNSTSEEWENGTLTASEVGAIATTAKGANNGVAELDSSGKVPSSQLPSYVDDVLEYSSTSAFPSTGETGKIYVATDTNKTYRWSGTDYVEISASLALGETSSTAYRGDRGKTAYDHATDSSRLTTAQTSGLYKIATTAEGHVASVTAVAKADITALGIPGSDTSYSAMTSTELETGTATDLRVVRADYLKTAINNLIDAKVGVALNASY